MPDKPSNTPKVMDVAPPGKTTPPATSRPVIVSNRPMIQQDPMMAPTDDVDGPKENATPIAISHTAKTIEVKPIDTKASAEPVAEPAEEVAEDKKTQVEVEKPAETPIAVSITPKSATEVVSKPASTVSTPEAPKPVSPPTQTPPEDSSIEDSQGQGDDQLAPNQVLSEAKRKEEERKAAILAEQEKVIESKKYYLPIRDTEKHNANLRAFLILLLVVLLTLVWFDLVLDAGVIHISGLHAFTNFFHSSTPLLQ